jgi:ubiquitin-like 1-activating enzyme E1 B
MTRSTLSPLQPIFAQRPMVFREKVGGKSKVSLSSTCLYPAPMFYYVSEMAGNIIPAIATTNAIIAGLIVLQALHMLRKTYNALRNVHVQFRPNLPLSTINLSTPNPKCGVCRDTYTQVLCDPARVTLGQVVQGVLGGGNGNGTGPREISVYEEQRVLSDPDWDDNNERTLESLNVTQSKFLSIVDEESEYATIQVAIGALL